MIIELRHLRYFVAVAEEASFTAAAHRVHVALTAFERAYPQVRMSIQAFDMTQPSAGLLDHGSDVAFVRPPVAAAGIEAWCEHVAAGHGISLCPASAARFHGRPGVCFVPSAGLPPTTMCVAWRTGDTRPAVRHFVRLAAESEPRPDSVLS